MAQGAGDELRPQAPVTAQSSLSPLEECEANIARTRERLSVTLTALNGEVHALLDPDTPISLSSGGSDSVDLVAVGLRTTGQLRAIARTGKLGGFAIVTVLAGLGLFLYRSGIARRLWGRKQR